MVKKKRQSIILLKRIYRCDIKVISDKNGPTCWRMKFLEIKKLIKR